MYGAGNLTLAAELDIAATVTGVLSTSPGKAL
jgi:hypothetical protein